MATLNVLDRDESIEFTRLRAAVNTSGGNLGAHLETLERAGYVITEKSFVGRRPQTRIRATDSGRAAFAAHVALLQQIVSGGTDASGRESEVEPIQRS
jgi:DNA-binding MarR family transcriptional regulator